MNWEKFSGANQRELGEPFISLGYDKIGIRRAAMLLFEECPKRVDVFYDAEKRVLLIKPGSTLSLSSNGDISASLLYKWMGLKFTYHGVAEDGDRIEHGRYRVRVYEDGIVATLTEEGMIGESQGSW